ncbi:glycosyltransferase family 1 protein [Lacrimispora sp.]|uniref:glycosyltransferase family 1 protein n=1 Tax=Lacrimispora sp. TaxID=2719234 RepID=UPI0032E43CB5
MVRILHAVNIMDRAGLETMLMNYYRHMDHNLIQFDFLTHRSQEGAYDEEIKVMGGNVYHAPRLYIQNIPKYFMYMKSFFLLHNEYQIIHSHIDAMSFFSLLAAKKNGISIRIAHSHSSKLDKDLKLPIKYFALKNIHNVATHNCACGALAGRFMFSNEKFKIINNAIDLKKFKYDKSIREEIRNHYEISDKFVIGHVGRYCYIKNQLFLLDIFAEVKKYRPESILLLIGKGPDEQQIRKKAKKLGLEDDIKLLVDRSDVNRIYQALDVFVMPSLFEGLPVVGVEAQANGIPCIVSDKISKEILLTSCIEMLSVEQQASEWASKILNCNCERNQKAEDELRAKGYDVVLEAKKLQDWYIDLDDKTKGIKQL